MAPARTVWVGAGASQWYLRALGTSGWGSGCPPQPWSQYPLALHPMKPPGMVEIGVLINQVGENLERNSNSKKEKEAFLHMVPLPPETLRRPAGVQCPARRCPGHPQLQKSAVYGSLQSSEFSGIADLAPKILTGWLQEIKKHKTSPHEQCSNRHLWHLPFLNLVVSESLTSRYLGSFRLAS